MPSASASGFYVWKHMNEKLSAHENSPNHKKLNSFGLEFSKRIRLGRTGNSENQKKTKMKVYVVGNMLRSENIDVCSAVEMIDKARQPMVEMRSSNMFQQALIDARDFLTVLRLKQNFKNLKFDH
ncbi:hypothetical protein AVEN_246408-1 [Araneus ventricosus]|uniref:Uncharacterized protein n=1 Tax=Araneus ventricosus TaxID=182803 RepID=A0A4Y2LPN1_ARAVE|nr:hypothetical protein AVEN_246408-1 [Araneus ventricosus]